MQADAADDFAMQDRDKDTVRRAGTQRLQLVPDLRGRKLIAELAQQACQYGVIIGLRYPYRGHVGWEWLRHRG
ncbi:hypothetical protein GCM10007386_38250 [Pseudoduganella dura]|nr:hypothetical protein GCM10007386_38250 [Pseudoduganella dura]